MTSPETVAQMKVAGKIFARPSPAQKGEINHYLFDRFTLVHLGIGICYGYLGLKLWLAIALA